MKTGLCKERAEPTKVDNMLQEGASRLQYSTEQYVLNVRRVIHIQVGKLRFIFNIEPVSLAELVLPHDGTTDRRTGRA